MRATRLQKAGAGILISAVLVAHAADASAAVPSEIQLLSVKQSGVKICVIGSSQQLGSVPAYYLAKGTTTPTQGVWQLATSAPTETINKTQVQYFTALELGTEIRSLMTSPSTAQPYVNSGGLRFYAVPPSTDCANIQYTFADTTSGAVNTFFYPYPSGLLELSAYLKGGSQVLTIDTSNVDSFQVPMLMTFATSSTVSPTTVLGYIGNSVYSPLITRRTMIAGANGTGGEGSPFVTWLRAQAGADKKSPALAFLDLALSSAGWTPNHPSQSRKGSWPYASIESPQDFLASQCTLESAKTGSYYVPAQCDLNGQLIGGTDPLNSFYDTELKAFFRYARIKEGTKQHALIVMGDASAIGDKSTWIPESSWTVDSNTADCPVYLKPDGASLKLTATAAYKNPIIVCNPFSQVVQMAGTPIQVTQATDSPTAIVQISQAQYEANKKKKGWNFGQPESGWIGNITNIYQQNANYYIALNMLTASPTSMPVTQTLCTSQCPSSNGLFKIWLFSNLQWGNTVNPFETSSRMVFANDGAFNSWGYVSEPNLATVTQSIERNIVWAFAHGIANCNNVTAAYTAIRPGYCAGVKRLSLGSYVQYAAAASDAFWVNEANWYPKNGPQNYYAEYLHTARLDKNTAIVTPKTTCDKDNPCYNMFVGANNSIPNGHPDSSNQRIPMGMAYGFGYDETPDYLTEKASGSQVPSKLDPIPWDQAYVRVVIGNVE